MAIRRTYGCPNCNHVMDVVLTAEQWDQPPPPCPECERREMAQQFRPVAIKTTAATTRDTANKIAEDIAATDYHVADMQRDKHEGATPKVRYTPKDIHGRKIADNRRASESPPSNWGVSSDAVQSALSWGRQTRMQFGSGLDVLQSTLKDGSQPDLIELSKKRSARIW